MAAPSLAQNPVPGWPAAAASSGRARAAGSEGSARCSAAFFPGGAGIHRGSAARLWCGRGGVVYGALQAERTRRNSGIVRAGTSLLTASRVVEGSAFVRVMGPGKADVNGIGRLLVFDEFFEFPTTDGLLLRDPDTLLESLTYYCDEPSALKLEGFSEDELSPSASPSEWESFSEVESFHPRHGVHLYLKSNLRSVKQGSESGGSGDGREDSPLVDVGGSLVLPLITHLREASTITPVTLEAGADVRVIAGTFGEISMPPPLHDFVMLDVRIRPGSSLALPLDPSFGILIYILEGVGIFEPDRFEEDTAPFYQNEGHGLYIPPSPQRMNATADATRVRTHEWSHLRFILLGAPIA